MRGPNTSQSRTTPLAGWFSPSRLRGPVTHNRLWWYFAGPKPAEPALSSDAVRLDLVARVRGEIADGRYDTPDKWDAALTRLLARLERE